MKCLYYLAPSLDSTQQISDDLHEVGISDFFLHVVSKDESGLKREHIHSSNYLETLDIVRDGFIGAGFGWIAGLIGAGLVAYFEPFGPDMPGIVYVIVVGVTTLFGAWVGGLTGVDQENSKLTKFHDDIEAGKYLILIYARKEMDDVVRQMMKRQHPEARLAGVDRHFINPFSDVRRRSRERAARERLLQKD